MRAAALALLVLTLAPAAVAGRARGSFSYTGQGTNQVNIQSGELREVWHGRAKPWGKITAHVAGWIERPDNTHLTVHASMVIAVPGGDVLIGACTGSGTLPEPDGAEDWTCDATGGTGRFERATGGWKLHIDIHRVSISGGVQKNRFTESGSGRIA